MQDAVNAIRRANQCIIFTGAGMSKDSGVDTFRGGSGLWDGCIGKCILMYAGVPFGWKLTPGLVWSYFISNFYAPIVNAKPHDGYYSLNDLRLKLFNYNNTNSKRSKYHIITMNVDGLHQESGIPDEIVYEIHGTIKKFCCMNCKKNIIINNPIETKYNCPKCECGGYARPDVTLFTESLPIEPWQNAENAINSLRKNDVLIVIGTSSLVYPAAYIPKYAKQKNATIIEINPDDKNNSPLKSLVDIYLKGTALNILPTLINQVTEGYNINEINDDDHID